MDNPYIELAPNFYTIPGERGWPQQFSSHSYIFVGEEKTVLVDPGCITHKVALADTFRKLGKDPDLIIVTHEHWDHMTAADYFPHAEKACSKFAIDAINRKDNERVRHEQRGISYTSKFDRALEDGEVIDLGNFKLEVLLTPGHTAGSLCLYESTRNCLVTGDTMFKPPMLSGIFGGGSRKEHIRSLERLFKLSHEKAVQTIYPGHDDFITRAPLCLDALEETLERAREDLAESV
jgi:glyoxylase-like metal-dependent hydrolase (beta-lactamase superfamily II)